MRNNLNFKIEGLLKDFLKNKSFCHMDVTSLYHSLAEGKGSSPRQRDRVITLIHFAAPQEQQKAVREKSDNALPEG